MSTNIQPLYSSMTGLSWMADVTSSNIWDVFLPCSTPRYALASCRMPNWLGQIWNIFRLMKIFLPPCSFYRLDSSIPRECFTAWPFSSHLTAHQYDSNAQCGILKERKLMSYGPEKEKSLVTLYKARDVSWLHLSTANLFECGGCHEDLQTLKSIMPYKTPRCLLQKQFSTGM